MDVLTPYSRANKARHFFKKVYPEHILFSLDEDYVFITGPFSHRLTKRFPRSATYVILNGKLIMLLW